MAKTPAPRGFVSSAFWAAHRSPAPTSITGSLDLETTTASRHESEAELARMHYPEFTCGKRGIEPIVRMESALIQLPGQLAGPGQPSFGGNGLTSTGLIPTSVDEAALLGLSQVAATACQSVDHPDQPLQTSVPASWPTLPAQAGVPRHAAPVPPHSTHLAAPRPAGESYPETPAGREH